MGSAFIKTEILSETSYLGDFSPRAVLLLYFAFLTNKTEGKQATQTCQAVSSLKQ